MNYISATMPVFLRSNLSPTCNCLAPGVKFQENTACKSALNAERPGFLPGPVEGLSVN